VQLAVSPGFAIIIAFDPANSASDTGQIAGVAIAAINLAMQLSQSHKYMGFMTEQHKRRHICPSAFITTPSGELVDQMYGTVDPLIHEEVDKCSDITSVKENFAVGKQKQQIERVLSMTVVFIVFAIFQ
jgi:hypothetical protein